MHRHVTYSLFCYLSLKNRQHHAEGKAASRKRFYWKGFPGKGHRAIVSPIKDGYERNAILVAA